MNGYPFPIIHTSDSEKSQIDRLSLELLENFGSIKNPNFIASARMIAFERLPRRHIQEVLKIETLENSFRAIIVKDTCTINQDEIGDTPFDWKSIKENASNSTARFELLQYLYLSLIGYVIEIEEQRGGGACHNVVPISGFEDSQTGASSLEALKMHTEDAPLENCCHYLSMLCIRNFENAKSSLCSIHDLQINEEDRKILSGPNFIIPADPSVKRDTEEEIEYKLKSVFYGNPQAPYVRVAFADQLVDEIAAQMDDAALEALKRLEEEVELTTIHFSLNPGDLVIFSNLQCLHGRGAFTPNQDKTRTRWMKRMMAVDGLSYSLKHRNPGSRLIMEKSNQ